MTSFQPPQVPELTAGGPVPYLLTQLGEGSIADSLRQHQVEE